jgi:hypothetical protein
MVLTEPLYLVTYGLFAAAVVVGYVERKGAAWWALVGALLGLAALARPTLMAIVPLLPALLIVEPIVRKEPLRPAVIRSLCVLLVAIAVVGVWTARSATLFGSLALTDPAYLQATISDRIAYDRMSWLEWLGGWIYYLPDFGDDLVRAIFGKQALTPLAWGPESYYQYGLHVLYPEALAHTAPGATGFLLKHVLSDPLKFTAVTALLIWRGIFVGRYLGLVGLPATVVALWLMPPRQRDPLTLLALLGFGIAAVYGVLSVSITRFNLALIPVYSVSLVWVTERVWTRFATSRKHE